MLREARRQDSHPAQGPVDDWSGVSAAAVESFATADSSADAPVKPTEIQSRANAPSGHARAATRRPTVARYSQPLECFPQVKRASCSEMGSPFREVAYPFHCPDPRRFDGCRCEACTTRVICGAACVVPRRLGVHGLPGLVALARRGGVPGVRMDGGRRGVGTGVAVRGLSQAGVAHGGDDLREHAHAADGVVRSGLVHDR